MSRRKERETSGTGQPVDIDALIAGNRKKDPAFREAYDELREEVLLSRALAEMRERKGLSQRALAKKLHTSQAAISRLERSDYEGHSITMLRKYVKAVGGSLQMRLSMKGSTFLVK